MEININYFIAVCILFLVSIVVENIAFRKVVRERNEITLVLGLYVEKFGQQSFKVDGKEIQVIK